MLKNGICILTLNMKVKHPNICQKAPIQSLQLGNTSSLSEKLTKSKKCYSSIRTNHPVLENGTFILLYSIHSNSHNLVSATWKYLRTLKEINRILKYYENIIIFSPIMGNGTFILIYSKVQRSQTHCPPPPPTPPSLPVPLGTMHLDSIWTTTIWSLGLGKLKTLYRL